MRNDKRRMRKIELQIESCIFVRIDDQRGIKSEIHGYCQAACAAGSAKNLNLTRRNCGAGRGRNTRFGIGGSSQQMSPGLPLTVSVTVVYVPAGMPG